MKYVAILATMLFFCSQTRGQEMVSSFVNDENISFSTTLQYSLKSDPKPRGLRQRNIGRTLTIGGLVAGFAGVIVFTDARKGEVIANGQVTQEPEFGKMMAGIYLIEAGVGMLVPGIILWKKGQKKYNRYLEEQSVSFHSTGSTFAVRYRF